MISALFREAKLVKKNNNILIFYVDMPIQFLNEFVMEDIKH